MRFGSFLLVTAALVCALLRPSFAVAQHAFESEIVAYETQDRANPPPLGSVVVTGSSSIVKWTTIHADLAPLDVIARGFGGSTTDDLDYYLDRIVLVYQPRAVVIYEGENDIDNGQTPTYVATRMAGILARISARLPNARVYVISIKPSPFHFSLWNGWETWANQLLAALSASDVRYTYIDITSHLVYSDNSQVVPGLWDSDGVHLNSQGYQYWASAIRAVLLPQQLLPMPADSTPPTAPTPTASAVSTSRIDVSWSGAKDSGAGLAGYNLFRNGQWITGATTNTYSDTGLSSNTLYTYTVTAFDRSPNHNESGQSAPASATTKSTSTSPPTVSLQVNPNSVPIGGTTQLSWTSTNATSCSASGGWAGAMPTSGSATSGALSTNTIFTLTCTGNGGTASDSKSVSAVAAPTVSLTVSPASVARGATTQLAWTTSGATSCTASGGWSGSRPPVGNETSGALSTSTTFKLTCSGVGGSGSDSKTVAFTGAAAPTVSLNALPWSVASGGKTQLSWSSTNATSCTASGGWSGAQSTSGNATSAALSANTTFTLTCTGAGGTVSDSETVTVVAAPTVSLTATPSSLASGAKAQLAWTSTNASSCAASGGWSGGQPTSGNATSSALTANTTFTLTCTGTGGTATATATVNITAGPPPPPAAPTVQLSDDSPTLAYGATEQLKWTSANATSCNASGAWTGSRGTSGAEATPALTASSTFAMTCSGPGGDAKSSVTIAVAAAPAPTVALTANPTSVAPNGTLLLSWTSTNATACTASNGWTGSRPASGTETSAALTDTTNFGLVCSGPGGTASASVDVTVVYPEPTVTLNATPGTVTTGTPAKLSWAAQDASDCAASGAWNGKKAVAGDEMTAPLATQSAFSLSCSGPGGSTNVTVMVKVQDTPPPSDTITATASTKGGGGGALDWWDVSALLALLALRRLPDRTRQWRQRLTSV